MTDTTFRPPVTFKRWQRATDIPHSYSDEEGNPVIIMSYSQYDDLAFWRRSGPDLSAVKSMAITIGNVRMTYLATCGSPPAPETWGRTWNGMPGTFTGLTFTSTFHETGFATLMGTADRDVVLNLRLNARLDSVLDYSVSEVVRYQEYQCTDTLRLSGRGARIAPVGTGTGMLNLQSLGSAACNYLTINTRRVCISGKDTCQTLNLEYDCGDGILQIDFFDH
jgi:hypothetical protein